jgi:hypothetical protein
VVPSRTASPGEQIQPTSALGPSSQYAGICTLDAQKKFTRAYLDEVYLWYNEIVDVDPNQFSTTTTPFPDAPNFTAVDDYFNALLVRTRDANGVAKDRFSAVLPTSLVDDGLEQANAGPPLSAVTTTAGTVASPAGRTVGYVKFDAFDFGAQDQLISAFRNLQAQGVQDLILDLRANSGGFLYIAQTLASMVTSPANLGRIFEQLHYNNKRDALSASSTLRFTATAPASESQFPAGTPLPQLSLPRVFVLTTGATCSASESVINSLRGIDVQVIRIGTTTCGKPYGFSQQDNCGIAYFPIEFQGTNDKGFGDYTTGFAPTCQIADRRAADVPPGDTTRDPLMRGALTYVDTNACPAGTGAGSAGVQGSARALVEAEMQPNRPSWRGRMLLPQQQQH